MGNLSFIYTYVNYATKIKNIFKTELYYLW